MSLDLFEFSENNSSPQSPGSGPLAHRMRPRTLDEVVGQEKVLGKGKPLRQWIEADRIPSLILWGPPGCGKTTLSGIIAAQTQSVFESVSAVLVGVKELKEIVFQAQELKRMRGRKTILFVDEIHRFNKSQQDALLPHVENGTVTLIGATTENPSFEINSALLSRARVIRFERLATQDLVRALQRALIDPNHGLGGFLRLTDEALSWLAEQSEGDARRALTALEAVALSGFESAPPILGIKEVQEALESALERQSIPYDKSGEEHYNVISAFIKSIRDSDADAALYYLARMIEGGEDPLFIARRLVILASEDVGNADPRGIMVAIAVKEAVEFVGMPEARINLAQAVTYLSMAPKSNASYDAINQAIQEVRKSGALPVPLHLRNAVTGLMQAEGYGKGYRYPHAENGIPTRQSHLPSQIEGKRFYSPRESGLERQFRERLKPEKGSGDGVS